MKGYRGKGIKASAMLIALAVVVTGCSSTTKDESKAEPSPAATATASAPAASAPAPSTAAADSPSYKPGTYKASISGHGGDIEVAVTLSESRIEKIEIIGEAETEGLGKPALEKMAAEIIKAQNLNVDTVSGASESSNAVIEAVAAAVDQAGGNSQQLKKADKQVVQGVDEEVTTDIVVVGGGAAGTSAALAATELGAKVVIIEKGDTPGGAGRYMAQGLMAINSKQQQAAGVKYSVDDAYKFMEGYTHELNNGELTRKVLEQSASTIDWLASYGVATKLIGNTQKAHEATPPMYHKYSDRNQAYENMYAKLKEKGATLYTSTSGKELIKGADGAVTGIVAEKADGGKLTVNAKKVILATGGYAGSDEMLRKHLNVSNYTTMAYANNTGDGINMAMAAGADEHNLSAVAVHSALIPSKDPAIWRGITGQLINLPLMWVNREGKRFVDEGIVYDFALMGNAVVAQGGEFFVVLDEETMKTLATKGSDLTNSFEKTMLVETNGTSSATGKVAPMKDLYESMKKTIDAKVAFKGNTLDELAKQMGVDSETLKTTAAAYTKAVQTGNDPAFLKKKDYMKFGVSKGPFYAVKAAALVEDSIGGVRVNGSLQVLNEKFAPISGLYAAGCDAGGLFGDSYPTLEGMSLSFAFNSGRLAGYAAANALK